VGGDAVEVVAEAAAAGAFGDELGGDECDAHGGLELQDVGAERALWILSNGTGGWDYD
jgi:hypothetical protein